MRNSEAKQLEMRKAAIRSFIAQVVAALIQFFIIWFEVDRKTSSVITFLLFWPIALFALFQAIDVFKYYIRNFRSLNIIYLLLTIPAFVFFVYVIYILFKGFFK